MFLRSTKRFKDGKRHTYWSMVENVRVGRRVFRIARGEAEPPKAVARGVLSSIMRAINDDSMMLLTSLPVNGSFESMWRIVEGYLTRWRIEETIRFVKQAYGFENIRVLSYRLWKRTSPFIHRGEMRFDGLKMGKVQLNSQTVARR